MYTYKDLGYGITLHRPDGTDFCFLQGDDADTLRDAIERAENSEYPSGPFNTAEELISVLIDAYDSDVNYRRY